MVGWAGFGPEMAEQNWLSTRHSMSNICGSLYLLVRVPERVKHGQVGFGLGMEGLGRLDG